MWDDKNLYVAFEVQSKSIVGGFPKDAKDPHLWEKDTTEIMIDLATAYCAVGKYDAAYETLSQLQVRNAVTRTAKPMPAERVATAETVDRIDR